MLEVGLESSLVQQLGTKTTMLLLKSPLTQRTMKALLLLIVVLDMTRVMPECGLA